MMSMVPPLVVGRKGLRANFLMDGAVHAVGAAREASVLHAGF